jgi:hypothetical protein
MIMGDPHDCLNFFQWKEVRLHLPRVAEYDPSGDSKPLGEIDAKIDVFLLETMSQHFRNEEA